MLHLVVVSPKEKKKKRNIDNDLAILPSHDNILQQELTSIQQKERMQQHPWRMANVFHE